MSFSVTVLRPPRAASPAASTTARSTPSPRPAGDRYFFDGKAGYAWSPAHYDEQGNTTLEFEGMVIWSYFGLGVQLMRASFDENLDRAAYLTDACVYGLFSLHGVSMLFSALADYDREYGHVMPYGDLQNTRGRWMPTACETPRHSTRGLSATPIFPTWRRMGSWWWNCLVACAPA